MNNVGKHWKHWKTSGSCGRQAEASERQVGVMEDKQESWKTRGICGSPWKRSEEHGKGQKGQDVTVHYKIARNTPGRYISGKLEENCNINLQEKHKKLQQFARRLAVAQLV